MTNYYEHMTALYEEREAWRQHRTFLRMLFSAYMIALPLMLALTRLIMRRSALFYWGWLAGMVLIMSVVGLNLLATYVRNEVRGHELRQEIRDMQQDTEAKAKRSPEESPGDFGLGPDGELMPLDELKHKGRSVS